MLGFFTVKLLFPPSFLVSEDIGRYFNHKYSVLFVLCTFKFGFEISWGFLRRGHGRI